MTRAGIRELRQNASALIRRVIAGETIEVTDRGRPVARIVPLRGRSVIDQMVAEGRATETRGELLDLKPIQPVTGRRRLSEVLAALRADERCRLLRGRLGRGQAPGATTRDSRASAPAGRLAEARVGCPR